MPIADFLASVEYIFTTARGPTNPPQDRGLVTVIDGQILKVTPFMVANIPPPMSLHDITVPSNALDVVFNDNASFAVLCRDGVSVFDYEDLSASGPPPALKGRITFEGTSSPHKFRQAIAFAPNNEVLLLQRSPAGSFITRYIFDADSSTMKEELSDKPASVISTVSSFTENGLLKPFAQDVSGALFSILPGSRPLSCSKFPSNLPWTEIVPTGDSHIAFGMSASGHLYANSRLLVKNCTSFLVTPAHLIFTTTTHLIKFVHIMDVNSMSASSNLIQ